MTEGLIQYLWNGDYLGFIRAIFVNSFGGNMDAFVAVVALCITLPLYIRTKSLMMLGILWILCGGILIAVSPVIGMFAVFFLIFGIGAVMYRLYMGWRE